MVIPGCVDHFHFPLLLPVVAPVMVVFLYLGIRINRNLLPHTATSLTIIVVSEGGDIWAELTSRQIATSGIRRNGVSQME